MKNRDHRELVAMGLAGSGVAMNLEIKVERVASNDPQWIGYMRTEYGYFTSAVGDSEDDVSAKLLMQYGERWELAKLNFELSFSLVADDKALDHAYHNALADMAQQEAPEWLVRHINKLYLKRLKQLQTDNRK